MERKLYSPQDAINYALTYGQIPNPEYKYFGIYGELGGDCTNFISQCLRAGGAPFSYDRKAPWWYNGSESINRTSHSWSLSWAVAYPLYLCLVRRAKLGLQGLKGEEVPDISQLELGDLIFYENFKGRINHSAIITGFENGMPLITQHSVEAVNISYVKKNKLRMHFVKIEF